VARGVLFSLLGVVAGIIVTVILWQFGFVASITSFLMAWLTLWLYIKGAKAAPHKGIPAVIAVILIGAVLCLVGAIVSDAYVAFSQQYSGMSVGDLLGASFGVLGDPEVWSAYGINIVIFIVFAALGIFSTLRRLGGRRRR